MQAPVCGNPAYSPTTIHRYEIVNFSIACTDNTALGNYYAIFDIGTGQLSVLPIKKFTSDSTNSVGSYILQVNLAPPNSAAFRFFVNDTSGNFVNSSWTYFTIVPGAPSPPPPGGSEGSLGET